MTTKSVVSGLLKIRSKLKTQRSCIVLSVLWPFCTDIVSVLIQGVFFLRGKKPSRVTVRIRRRLLISDFVTEEFHLTGGSINVPKMFGTLVSKAKRK